MGVSYLKEIAIKTENQGWMLKKFKTVDDMAIGVSGEQNKKIEPIKELDQVQQLVGVEKLSILEEKEEFDDVVILLEEIRVATSVC